MVVSILDDSINYIETRTLDKDDDELDRFIFLIEVMDIPILIAVGKQKYTFIEKEIIYLPFYLISNGTVEGQIGVYEFMSSQVPDLISDYDDEEINIEKLNEPLMYSFVTKEYLEKHKADSSYKDVEQSDSEEESDLSVIEDEDEGGDEESDFDSIDRR